MNFQAFLDTLPIMAKGMAGIFVVIVILYGSIVGLRKLFPVKADKEEKK